VYISDHKTENFFENGQQFYTKFWWMQTPKLCSVHFITYVGSYM
jgi:hypothetical protein